MTVSELAGREETQGKSAEFSVQAWMEDGVAGNTRGTVRRTKTCGGAIRLQSSSIPGTPEWESSCR